MNLQQELIAEKKEKEELLSRVDILKKELNILKKKLNQVIRLVNNKLIIR